MSKIAITYVFWTITVIIFVCFSPRIGVSDDWVFLAYVIWCVSLGIFFALGAWANQRRTCIGIHKFFEQERERRGRKLSWRYLRGAK